MSIICIYDATLLTHSVIRDAELTHPVVISSGRPHASGSYLGPGRFPPSCDQPLPPPADDAASVEFDGHLGPVREFSADQGRAAGLDPRRVTDLVIAVSEIAANALGHAGGVGAIRFWCTGDEILCQVEDSGHARRPATAPSRRRRRTRPVARQPSVRSRRTAHQPGRDDHPAAYASCPPGVTARSGCLRALAVRAQGAALRSGARQAGTAGTRSQPGCHAVQDTASWTSTRSMRRPIA
jgi:Histidine kinase-like ATPase domain